MPKPVICAIEGACIGGALELALACDLRVMAADAIVGMPETRIGLIPDVGGASRLPQVVGLGRAKELIMTGRLIGAEEAERIGLVSLCVDDHEAHARALAVASDLAAGAQSALRLTKLSLNNWYRAQAAILDASLAFEFHGFGGPDAAEGLASHREKRAPRFTGEAE